MRKKSKMRDVRISDLNDSILSKFQLVELFNDDCLLLKERGRFQDLELYKDIQEAKNYIEYLNKKEDTYRKRYAEKKSNLKSHEDRKIDIYKKYAQKEILGLSDILRKQPVRISLDFDQLIRVGIKSSDYINDILEGDTEYKRSGKKEFKEINQLLKKKSLSDLFFYLTPSWGDSKRHEESYSSIKRMKLTTGIFDYLQRILIGKGGYHLKKCKQCFKWYVARRSVKKYCDDSCRYDYQNERKRLKKGHMKKSL